MSTLLKKQHYVYYPTSPSTAILVSWKSGKEKYSEKIADEEYVRYLNDKICKNALSYIFAESVDDLSFLAQNNSSSQSI